MKNFIRLFFAVTALSAGVIFAPSAFAADETMQAEAPKQITFSVKIVGVTGFGEFDELSKSVQKISGVDELLPAKLARGEATLAGKFTGDTAMLINDMAVATMDRYKLEKKQSKNRVDFKLSKM